MVSQAERYQKHPSIVSREIAGEVILVPISRDAGDIESIYTLNETAAFAWTLLDGKNTLEEVSNHIVAEFEVGEKEARQDLMDLATQLLEVGAIVKV